ncbi:OsmC family peroxiredoxin [Candidatus Roseilinea sp. NK_OTU-006]|jgi:osmotically inducible protein OsmC|uniref:OsmC family peroxiredoxin n=1 Tax=Candidatus Roseilinea sp. NK_OTU-006 TaxID=2704250 RepID=UPI00145CC5AD|nr:OsmC family peroxiredoxin [Candidatus Roseilinea sp. NK_OTU-006]
MPARIAEAVWQGTLQEGSGTLKLGSGVYEGPYTYLSRFEEGAGTNPEELLGAAEAGCFTMALGARLSRAGFIVNRIATTATVYLEKNESGFSVTRIDLVTEGDVSGVDEASFRQHAEEAENTCIISRALNVPLTLSAKLIN